MEVGKVQFLINKAKEIREFCNTYNNLDEYNAGKSEDDQLVELKHNFLISFDKNNNFSRNTTAYMSKHATCKEGYIDMGSPWIDFLCFKKNKDGNIINLLDMDFESTKLFWEGFKEYINNNKEEILDYVSTYMLANISKQYKEDLKKEKEKIEKMINTL